MKTRSIEVDDLTADALSRRAAERGISVTELLADLVLLATATAADADIEELDRRWQAFEAQETVADSADVVRWLQSWGRPDFKSFHQREARE